MSDGPQFDPVCVRVDPGGRKWYQSNTFLFDFYTHYTPILHRLATRHNVADRQRDMNRLPIIEHWRSKSIHEMITAKNQKAKSIDLTNILI